MKPEIYLEIITDDYIKWFDKYIKGVDGKITKITWFN